jgi:sec-independent protein translocase protein TatA
MTAEIFGEQGLIVIAVIVLFMFGGSKLPELARSIGRAKKEFQDGLRDDEAEAEPVQRTEDRDQTELPS